MRNKNENKRFEKFARAYLNYFGGKKPVLTADGEVLTFRDPKSGFGYDQKHRSLQSAIDTFAYAFTVD